MLFLGCTLHSELAHLLSKQAGSLNMRMSRFNYRLTPLVGDSLITYWVFQPFDESGVS